LKKMTALLLLLPTLAACDINILGSDFDSWGIGGWGIGGGDWTASTVVVQGRVAIGPFQAMTGEVTVELFDPTDLTTPVAVSVTSGNQFTFDLGTSPRAAVCGYQLRGVLWNGEAGPMQSLFSSAPSPCTLAPGWITAAPLNLPAYAPLAAPFALEGTVLVDGRTARAAEIAVVVSTRDPTVTDSLPRARTDASGRYRIETRDGAQRFAMCSTVWAHVEDPSGRYERVQLEALRPADCGSMRTLPDARIGSLKAAVGYLYPHAGAQERHLGAGEAWAELIRIDDGKVGERFASMDDGTIHVWFPHDVRVPGCGWLLRTTLTSGASEVRELHAGGTLCEGPANHHLFTDRFSTPHAGPLELTVVDPVGDHSGRTDLTSMRLRFDPGTGIYEIVLNADTGFPFQGEFRVNLNLYNPSRQSLFQDNMNDFILSTPATTLRLAGYHPALRQWLPGDLVHTNSLAGTPNPPSSTLFRSGVSHFPMGYLTNEDVLAFTDMRTPAVVVIADR
jgi:hypothetical protein